MRHGTTRGYSAHGCRCDACRHANAAAGYRYRSRVRLRPELVDVIDDGPADPVVVDLVIRGESLRTRPADRRAVAVRMRSGHVPAPARTIAQTLGVTVRTVQRYLAQVG